MKTILDFAVWTLGVSLALPLYLEKAYLPRGHDFFFWMIVAAICFSLLSAMVGIWFRSGASKIVALDPDASPDGNERILGIGLAHSVLLIVAIAISAVLFFCLKVFPPTEENRPCKLNGEADGVSFVVEFDCDSSLKGIFENGKVVLP